ncbi:hypothetical protein SteCoe_35179 [Stentor coeruleus]|uniref:Uncharacterized protein n=1 Tax=Stentor coeruleus TaxID=5963 RepID=A0A1R2ASV3_9CILI|nr:hypothetical protein SteCoe_35179 [Stentor coeruleus]
MYQKNFKELLQNEKKLNLSQRFMHIYEKHRTFRLTFGVATGVFLCLNFLVIYPGNSLIMQKDLKKFTASTMVQMHYLKAQFIDTIPSWEKSLYTSYFYINKFRKDRIQDPWLCSQCIDLISKCFTKSKIINSLFFSSLKTLGLILEDITKLNPKLFMNPDLKSSLVHLIHTIEEASDFNDNVGFVLGNKEWINFVNLFLVLNEIGEKEKFEAYDNTLKILKKHDEAIEKFDCEEVYLRVLKDTVNEDKKICVKSLELLRVLVANEGICRQLVKRNLVYNLFVRVAGKCEENAILVDEIVGKIAGKGNAIWNNEGLEMEKNRIKALAKENKNKVLIELVKNF